MHCDQLQPVTVNPANWVIISASPHRTSQKGATDIPNTTIYETRTARGVVGVGGRDKLDMPNTRQRDGRNGVMFDGYRHRQRLGFPFADVMRGARRFDVTRRFGSAALAERIPKEGQCATREVRWRCSSTGLEVT